VDIFYIRYVIRNQIKPIIQTEMNMLEKLTYLIDSVDQGEIDTLGDLYRELIELRSEIQSEQTDERSN